jgi:hypothetical protein
MKRPKRFGSAAPGSGRRAIETTFISEHGGGLGDLPDALARTNRP